MNVIRHATAAAVLFSIGVASARAGLIDEYRFNESGTSAGSTGGDSAPVWMYDGTGTSADLHGGAGTGVSGLAGDRAFNNTASTGMGRSTNTDPDTGAPIPYVGGRAEQASDYSATDALRSFTLQGWFKTDSTTSLQKSAALVNNLGNGGGWALRADDATPGKLVLQVADSTDAPSASSGGTYTATQDWVYFAVSFDGSLTSDNVNFYQGSKTSGVSLVSTQTLAIGAAGDDDNPLKIANATPAGAVVRPFDGFLDDIRLFGSKDDASGVLSLGQLEGFRQDDIANVPEPGSLLLLGAGGAIAAWHYRRNRGHRAVTV